MIDAVIAVFADSVFCQIRFLHNKGILFRNDQIGFFADTELMINGLAVSALFVFRRKFQQIIPGRQFAHTDLMISCRNFFSGFFIDFSGVLFCNMQTYFKMVMILFETGFTLIPVSHIIFKGCLLIGGQYRFHIVYRQIGNFQISGKIHSNRRSRSFFHIFCFCRSRCLSKHQI